MTLKCFIYIQEKYSNSKERSQLLIKNIVASFIIKGWSLVVQLLLVPVALNCLTVYEYGLWLTLSSVITWMDNFDIGLSNGLRNKLAEAIAHDDKKLAKELISTAVIVLSTIALLLLCGLTAFVNTFDIYPMLNVDKNLIPNLRLVATLIGINISLSFAAKIIGSFFLALQKPAINNLMGSIASTLTLLGLWCLSMNNYKSFLSVCVLFTALPPLVYIAFSIYAFKYKYKELSPSIRNFKKNIIKSLVNLGMKFFVGQISGMLLMCTANLVISNAISPAEVASYQIAYRYFTMLTIVFTLVSTPMWSATTDAYNRGDLNWIRSTTKKIEMLVLVMLVILLIMLIFSNNFYTTWTANKVHVDIGLSIWVGIYTFILLASMCYSNIIYGIGKMNLTVATVFTMAIIFIAIAYPVTIHWGIIGLVVTQSIVTLICTIQNFIQCKLLLSGKAKGIFNK